MVYLLMSALLLGLGGAPARPAHSQAGPSPARCAPVHEAVAKGDAAMVTRLVQQDPAAASAPDGEGVTPLHAAAQRDLADVAAILLGAGADPIARDARGETPLAYLHPVHLLPEEGRRAARRARRRAGPWP